MNRKVCPICDEKFHSNDVVNLSLHLIQCATEVIKKHFAQNNLNNSNKLILQSSQLSLSQSNSLSSSAFQSDSQTDLAGSQNGTPTRSRRRKQTDSDNNNNSNDNDLKKSKALDDSTQNADEGMETSTQKKMTEEEYDNFLKTVKQGRFKRTGPWKGMNTPTPHQCTDSDCSRTWKPSPAQCIPDDYYCPSCVLHHRNNVDRFKEDRLKWTADVPNTFYVFSIVDPATKETLVKFGRTQHQDAWKRYPAKERRDYTMKLVISYRGRLETMTIIENWWKTEAEEKKLFCRFSDKMFHGSTECVKMDDKTFEAMLNKTKIMALADMASVAQQTTQ